MSATLSVESPTPAAVQRAGVLREPSTGRQRLAAAAKELGRWARDVAGQPMPCHERASALALAVLQAPYVSLAVIAHHWCLVALQAELDSWGGVESPVCALCNELTSLLHTVGMGRDDGQWCDDRAKVRPDGSDLIWDWSEGTHISPSEEEKDHGWTCDEGQWRPCP